MPLTPHTHVIGPRVWRSSRPHHSLTCWSYPDGKWCSPLGRTAKQWLYWWKIYILYRHSCMYRKKLYMHNLMPDVWVWKGDLLATLMYAIIATTNIKYKSLQKPIPCIATLQRTLFWFRDNKEGGNMNFKFQHLKPIFLVVRGPSG